MEKTIFCAFKNQAGNVCAQHAEERYRIGKTNTRKDFVIEYFCRPHFGLMQYRRDPIFKKICDDAKNAIQQGVVYPGKRGVNLNDNG